MCHQLCFKRQPGSDTWMGKKSVRLAQLEETDQTKAESVCAAGAVKCAAEAALKRGKAKDPLGLREKVKPRRRGLSWDKGRS